MALQNSIGYVRLAINTGFDEKSMSVNWMTFSNNDWRESNPSKIFGDIVEMGSHTFSLAITEKQQVQLEKPYEDEKGNLITHEEQEVIIGYLPQSMEQAHDLLRNLSGKDCNFKGVNWQVVI